MNIPHMYAASYVFGVLYNVISLSWVGSSFVYDPLFKHVGFLASIVLGFVYGVQFPLALRLGRRKNWIFIYVIIDFLRMFSPLGFPWNTIGVTGVWFLASVRFVGVYGLTLFILLLSQVLCYRRIVQAFLCASALILAVDNWLYIKNVPTYTSTYVRIIQPSIPQEIKWDRTKVPQHLDILLSLSRQTSQKEPNIVVWSESSIPFLLNKDEAARDIIKPSQGLLVLGNLSYEDGRYYVSMSALDSSGVIQDSYNKQMLVPFVEYNPLGIKLFGHGTYSKGALTKTLKLSEHLCAIPVICYETAFPCMYEHDADMLIIATNDTWFGSSSGPYQHLHLARIRALELGKPCVRAANSGISAFISPYGQILSFLPIGARDIIESHVPDKLEPTIYARFRFIPFFLMIFFFMLVINSSGRQSNKQENGRKSLLQKNFYFR